MTSLRAYLASNPAMCPPKSRALHHRELREFSARVAFGHVAPFLLDDVEMAHPVQCHNGHELWCVHHEARCGCDFSALVRRVVFGGASEARTRSGWAPTSPDDAGWSW
jgi:hypothetical protein